MRHIKHVVISVGVALSVTPIFNSALAQQSSSQANLLLEMQTMRQEIAELRDMVERQQYQLKKLQQANAAVGNNARNSVRNQPYGSTSQSYPVTTSPQSAYSNPQETPNVQSAVENQTVYSQRAGDAGPSTDSDFYLPVSPDVIADGSDVGTGQSQQVDTVATPQGEGNHWQTGRVDERVINAAPVAQNDSYPPVVDRSINSQTRSVPVTGAGTSSTSTENVFQQASPSQALPSDQYQQVQPIESPPAPVQQYQQPISGTQPNPNYSPPQAQVSRSVPSAQQVANQAAGSAGVVSVPSAAVVPNASQRLPQSASPPPPQQKAPARLAEDEYYGQGFELLKQSQYEQAASIFEQQLAAYPKGDLADDAHYWIAEAMHVSRKLDVAKLHLRKIISDYPQSRRLPDAMLKTAYIEQTQGNQIEARILFQEIVNLHPQSDAAIAAKNQLASSN